MFYRYIISLSRYFPNLGIKSAAVEKYWVESSDAEKYVSFSILVALLVGIIAGLIGLVLLGNEPMMFAVIFLAIFGLVFFFLLKLPEMAEHARMELVEAELPLLLRTLAMLLEMRVPFAQALKTSAKHGEVGKMFAKAVAEYEQGVGMPKALAKLAEGSRSGNVKKAVAQVISAYEHGANWEEVRRIADDMISMQRYRMRDFVSKSSFFGLLFTITTAIAPTLFLIFAIAGKVALGFEISTLMFLMVFLFGFPAIGCVLLLISRSQIPPSIFRNEIGWRQRVLFFMLTAAVALIMFSGLQAFEKLVAVVAVGLAAGAVAWDEWKESVRLEQIEVDLPNILLSVSGLPKNYGLENIFERMVSAGSSFSAEAEKTLLQLKANVSVEKVLVDLWKRNNSFMLRRMGELMLNAHTAGANISEKMHEMAEDLLRFTELKRERENAVSVQKYTLLLGSLVVPLILSVSLRLVEQISTTLGETTSDVAIAAPGAIATYIAIYSALSALYIADSENRDSRAVPYFLAMVVAGWISIYIISGQFA